MRKLYLRQCDICKSGMSLGYMWGDSQYMCGEYCYQIALIDSALWFADNEHFINAEDRLEWIQEVNHQLYVGWEPQDNWDWLYTKEGMVIEEHEINFGEDILVYAEEEDDWVVKETLITDDLEELLA